jgi:hypothetical protein
MLKIESLLGCYDGVFGTSFLTFKTIVVSYSLGSRATRIDMLDPEDECTALF